MGRFSYQYDQREKAWIVITWSGHVKAIFMEEECANIWTRVLNNECHIIEKPKPVLNVTMATLD